MPIMVTTDGRTIRSGQSYTEFRRCLYRFQDGRCVRCDRRTFLGVSLESENSFQVAHRGTRGMGAGYRDDVLGLRRGQVEGGLCGKCHREEHHQQ